MSKNIASSAKKAALLARKEKLLQDIQYYDKRIKEFPTDHSKLYYDEDSGSDEDIFPMQLICDPSISELRAEQKMLQTCLQATQELTNLTVLQSEINIMVEDPILEGEKPVTEPGSWCEVVAECRIDLVPFSLMFYSHRPSRKFAPTSFHRLQVMPVKVAHENELYKSVLSTLTKPSDAVEVLRSYAAAYRSRRTTLARLADRYANSLFMEPLAEGGFILKCANLLQMSWVLVNKLSPLSPFKHKMNFELDYMDESCLKIIKPAHNQLCNPSLTTDERTQLLAKIISTCLEAQTPTQLYESMESDQESTKRLEKTTLDTDDDVEEPRPKRTRDEDIMAPPKSLPKKVKPKGKENKDDNRKTGKRASSHVETTQTKKAKNDIVANLIQNNEDLDNHDEGMKDKGKGNKVGKEIEQEKDETNIVKKVSENNGSPKNAVKNNTDGDSMKYGNNDKVAKNNEAKSSKTTKVTDGKVSVPAKKIVQNTQAVKKVAGVPKVGKIVEKKTNEKNAKINQKSNVPTKNNDNENVKASKNDKNTENNNVAGNVQNENKENKSGSKQGIQNKQVKDKISVKNVNAKKNTDSTNIKEKSNMNANAKKSANIDPNAKKTAIVENSNKTANIDPNAKKTVKVVNAKKTANIDADAKKAANIDPNAKKTTNLVNAERSANIGANGKKSANIEDISKKSDNIDANAKKSTKNDPKDVTGKSSQTNDVKKTNLSNEVSERPIRVTSNTDNDLKAKDTTKKVSVASNDPKQSNVASNDPKKSNVASTGPKKSNVASSDPKKSNVASTDPSKELAKNFQNLEKKSVNQRNKPKFLDKSKMTVKTHRTSIGKPKKTITNMKTLKSNHNNESGKKNPLKKLSPNYAVVLQQYPLRISPRMVSKSPNIQMKLLKPVSNIPRLLRKPAPISK